MHTIDLPVFFHREMILQKKKQVIGRHHTAAEKVTSHPIIVSVLIKCIRILAMGEYVGKQPAVRL